MEDKFKKRKIEGIAALIILVLIIAVIVLLFCISETLFPGDQNRNGEVLKISLNIIGGYAVLIGLYFTYRRTISNEDSVLAQTEQIKLSRESQVDDRFKSAVEHLGKEEEPIVIGGIIELYQIAVRNKEKYATEVFLILCSYLKSNTTIKPDSEATHSNKLQTIIDFLFKARDIENFVFSGQRAKLNNCDLSKFNLDNAVLIGADFENSILPSMWNVSLKNADLSGAKFNTKHEKTEISRGEFSYHDIIDVNLSGANLKDVFFEGLSIGQLRFNDSTALRNVVFLNCEVSNIVFKSCSINYCGFFSCEMNKISFTSTDVADTYFIACRLRLVNFNNNKTLLNINFTGSTFEKFNLNSPLWGAVFTGCGDYIYESYIGNHVEILNKVEGQPVVLNLLNIKEELLNDYDLKPLTKDDKENLFNIYNRIKRYEILNIPEIDREARKLFFK